MALASLSVHPDGVKELNTPEKARELIEVLQMGAATGSADMVAGSCSLITTIANGIFQESWLNHLLAAQGIITTLVQVLVAYHLTG